MDARVGRRQFALGASLALLWPKRAFAGMTSVSLSELMANSDCCIVGRSLAAESSWSVLGGARRIVTVHRVRVDESLAGDAPGEWLSVRTLGGRVGDLAQRVFGEAELVPQQPALLFLARVTPALHVVTDMAGGYYPLADDGHGARRVRAMIPRTAGSAASLLSGAAMADVRRMLAASGWGRHAP